MGRVVGVMDVWVIVWVNGVVVGCVCVVCGWMDEIDVIDCVV